MNNFCFYSLYKVAKESGRAIYTHSRCIKQAIHRAYTDFFNVDMDCTQACGFLLLICWGKDWCGENSRTCGGFPPLWYSYAQKSQRKLHGNLKLQVSLEKSGATRWDSRLLRVLLALGSCWADVTAKNDFSFSILSFFQPIKFAYVAIERVY